MLPICPRAKRLETNRSPLGKKMHDRIVKSFSGGQQARLLLASALIQNPDLLLLDEPTNNLDTAGIEHLTKFLIEYPKTCIVISHDAKFLNAFTTGVLYLDVFTRKVEQYPGNYRDVLRDISARIDRENRKNAQLEKRFRKIRTRRTSSRRRAGRCGSWRRRCAPKWKRWKRRRWM